MANDETLQIGSVIDGSGGTRIKKSTYELFRRLLLEAIPADDDGIAYRELPRLIEPRVPRELLKTRGSCSWYVTSVKLDLEARGEIERLPGVRPQRLRRLSTSS